jgi:hypothetical protein
VKKGVAGNKQGVGPLAAKDCERRVDLATGAGLENLDCEPHGAIGRFPVPQNGFRSQRIGRIDEHGHTSRSGHQLAHKLQPLWPPTLILEN